MYWMSVRILLDILLDFSSICNGYLTSNRIILHFYWNYVGHLMEFYYNSIVFLIDSMGPDGSCQPGPISEYTGGIRGHLVGSRVAKFLYLETKKKVSQTIDLTRPDTIRTTVRSCRG